MIDLRVTFISQKLSDSRRVVFFSLAFGDTRFGFFTNAQNWQHWRFGQLCTGADPGFGQGGRGQAPEHIPIFVVSFLICNI